MLQVTTEAADWIRDRRPGSGPGAELVRLATDGAPATRVTLTFVSKGQPDDQYSESEGVSLCIAAELADTLDNKVIDVITSPRGKSLVLRAA